MRDHSINMIINLQSCTEVLCFQKNFKLSLGGEKSIITKHPVIIIEEAHFKVPNFVHMPSFYKNTIYTFLPYKFKI